MDKENKYKILVKKPKLHGCKKPSTDWAEERGLGPGSIVACEECGRQYELRIRTDYNRSRVGGFSQLEWKIILNPKDYGR